MTEIESKWPVNENQLYEAGEKTELHILWREQ